MNKLLTSRFLPLILATVASAVLALSICPLQISHERDSGIQPTKYAPMTRRLGKTAIIFIDLQAGRIFASNGIANEADVYEAITANNG